MPLKKTRRMLEREAEELSDKIDELRLARLNIYEALREEAEDYKNKHPEAYVNQKP